jgi:hypothetical protein
MDDNSTWMPSEEDQEWNATHNDDWHDLDGHPGPDDIAEADQWEADGHFDDMAGQSAYLDAHEQGLKTF